MEKVEKKKFTLSKREQILLLIMGCLAIVAGGYYLLIAPTMSKVNEQQTEYDTLSMEYQEKESTLSLYDDVDTLYEQTNKDYEEATKNFYELVESEDIDVLLTDLAIDYGFTPLSLNLSQITPQTVIPYGADTQESTATIDTMTVTQTVKMKQAYVTKISDFIDAINDIKGVELKTVNFSNEDNTTVTFNYNIYMIQK